MIGPINIDLDININNKQREYIKYNPKMTSPYLNSYKKIYFVPNIKLNKNKLIKKNNNKDLSSLFFMPFKLNRIVKNISFEENLKELSLEDSLKNNVLQNNINLLLESIFPKNKELYIQNKKFFVHSIKYIKNSFQILDTKPISFKINVEVNLFEIKKPLLNNKKYKQTFDKKMKLLTCKQRKENIMDIYKDILYNKKNVSKSARKQVSNLKNFTIPPIYSSNIKNFKNTRRKKYMKKTTKKNKTFK